MLKAVSMPSTPRTGDHVRFLLRLYGVRGVLALIWSCSFAMTTFENTWALSAMVAAYPLLDALASWRELAERRPDTGVLTRLNAWLSFAVTLTLLAVTRHGPGWALGTFGAWAVLSGMAQVLVAVSHGRSTAAAQWPMYVAGSLSVLAGATYVFKAMQPGPELKVFAVYAAGGGTFFIVQSSLLWWRSRRDSALAPAP